MALNDNYDFFLLYVNTFKMLYDLYNEEFMIKLLYLFNKNASLSFKPKQLFKIINIPLQILEIFTSKAQNAS